MKQIFLFIFSLLFIWSAESQTIMGRQLVDQYPTTNTGTLTYGLTWLPVTYNNTGRSYPLIISLHGTGESGSTIGDLAKMYNASPRAVAGRIADGWNAVAVNPVTGLMDSFIVVSPQAPSWSYSYVHLKYILPDIIKRYRVDTSRIYLAGLSAGGDGTYTTLGSRDSNFIKKFAAMATASTAGVSPINNPPGWPSYTSQQVETGIRFGSNYGVRMWTVCGEQDYLLNTGVRYHDSTNITQPNPPNKLTVILGVGHSAWGRAFDPAFRPNVNYYGRTGTCNNGCNNGGIGVAPNSNGVSVMGTGVTQDSLNVYEWFLLHKRNFAPVTSPSANAGNDQVLVLPANSAVLTGSGTPGAGYTISSYAWSKVGGPSSFLIQSPSSASTTVSNLDPGTYTFRLTVTNNIGATATDDVLVTVNAQSYASPRISGISPSQSITLPVNTVNLSSSYILTGATIQSVNWSKLKVPNQPKKRIGVIGSSTSEGNGASSGDSSYVGRLRNYLVSVHGVADSVINLGKSGYTVFHGMPSSYVPTGGQQTPDVTRNITAILNRNVDVVIVNYPSNGFDFLSIGEIMMAFRTIYDSCTARGVECFITTTQPRDEFGPTTRFFLKEIRDSILNRFGANAINFYDPITVPGATVTMPEYAYGDLIHVNNAGHRQLFNKVVAANILGKFAISASTIASPSTPNTTINNLTEGTHLFQLSVTDGHVQSVNGVVSVTVNPQGQNQPPVVNAGTDQTITLPVNSVTLNGSATDADGTISTYQWTKHSGPAGGTIALPAQAQTQINGLLQGTYEYILTAADNNGATATDTVRIVVNQALPSPCTNARSFTPAPAGDRGYYNTLNLNPGDTLYIDGTRDWSYFYVADQRGTPSCPIYIMNKSGMATLRGGQLKLRNCEYVRVLGTGVQNLQYGIFVKPYPDNTVQNGAFAVVVEGRSKNIEISNVSVRNCGIGFEVKEDGGCDPNYNFPNWIIDSISLHHNSIVNCWNQGMYLGNTSPDNGPNSYSPRPVVCNGVVTYPRPARLGNIKVYNNFIDSTGRGGIQLSSASKGVSEIYNNVVKHAGMGGDDAQGGGITIGAYTKAYIHDNTVVNTYTWGINSQGGSGTNVPLRIENNSIDSSGYLRPYVDQPSGVINDIRNTPTRNNLLIWPHSILIATKPTLFTDSTMFWIKTNSLGIRKNPAGIGLVDYQGTMHKSGNYICGNVNKIGGGVPVVAVEGTIPVYYSTNCNNGNTPPAANAGINQIITLPTNSVTLAGEGIDIDGTITDYLWAKVSGPAQGTITSPSLKQTTVTGMIPGIYRFVLTVTDNVGATGTDTVQITVNASNQPPTANAGINQTITLPTNSVTLNGSGTDADGIITAYLWTKLSGPSQGTITSPSQPQTTVTGMVQGVYQFVLTVTDNNGATGKDTVQVTVNPAGNQPPKANAGSNQNIILPVNSVTLSGSGTDVDGTITSYAWNKLSGPAQGAITTPSQAQTTVTGMVQGVYQFVLTVTDNNGATGKDTIGVIVNPANNQPPKANAGINQMITLPTNSVTLSGSGTDNDGTITSFLWSKLSGPTQGIITSPSQAQTTVTGMVQGVYQFVLTVTDNSGAIGKDTMQVTVNATANIPPTANAGVNQVITLPVNSVTLSGSGTDINGTITAYLWTKLSGPSQGTITSPAQPQTTVTGLVQGVYQFVLTVTDNNGAAGKDTVQVTVNAVPANQPPVANAGVNVTVTYPVNNVTLNGRGTDVDGTVVSYEWTRISGPAPVTITAINQPQTTINNLVIGEYKFVLTVTDNRGAKGTDTLDLIVEKIKENSTVKLYPNPAATVTFLKFDAATKTNKTFVQVYNAAGLLVMQQEFMRTDYLFTHQLDVSRLQKGTYFIHVSVDINNTKILRLVKFDR